MVVCCRIHSYKGQFTSSRGNTGKGTPEFPEGGGGGGGACHRKFSHVSSTIEFLNLRSKKKKGNTHQKNGTTYKRVTGRRNTNMNFFLYFWCEIHLGIDTKVEGMAEYSYSMCEANGIFRCFTAS